MADGTNTKAWQKFTAELKREGMDFADIQHADDKTRLQLLEAMPSLSPIDRASIMTTWKRLASKESSSTAGSSTPSRDPPPPMPHKERAAPPQRGQSAGRGPQHQQQFSQQQGSAFDPVQDYVPPKLVRGQSQGSPTSGRGSAPPKVQPPVLNVPVMNMGVGGGDLAALLRTALDRGDCGTALPLASEMLQTDPIGLVYMLNEYLPQLSVEQLKTILGIGMPLAGDAAGGSPTGGSPGAGSGRYSPASGRGRGASPTRQNSSPRNMQSFYGDDSGSPGVEMSLQPTINGQPLTAGQVLTAHSMQAQYGPRFTATSNGRALIFPYCVQRGDRIIVRSAQERLL